MDGEKRPLIEIIEGPQGSGKSHALLGRACALLDAGADPASLMVVCATKDGAAAFKRLLGFSRLEGPESVHDVRVLSARALSFEVLLQPEARALFGHGPRVLLDVERSVLIADLRLQGVEKPDLARACRELYGAWDAGELPEPQDPTARLYCHTLRDYGAYDVRELGARALTAVQADAALAARMGAAHVLVDDANLIGPAQLRLVEALAGESLVMAGDDSVANPFFDAAATGTSLARFARARGIEPRRLAGRAFAPDLTRTFVVKAPDPLCEAATCAKNVRYLLDHVAVDLAADNAREQRADGEPGDPGEPGTPGTPGEPGEATREVPARLEELVYPNEVCVVIPQGSALKDVCQKLKAAGVATVTCTEAQPVGGDPRHVASVATLQAFTLLGLAADPSDAVCWRVWAALGRSDLSCGAWASLVRLAAERGVGVPEALATLDPAAFEGADLLARRYAQARPLVERAARRRGRQLVDTVCPNENLTFMRLCEPVVAQDAAQFFAAANLGACDRGFGGRLCDVRVGVPAAFAGTETKACVLLGLNEGAVPRASREEAPARFENEMRLWRGVLAKSTSWLSMCYAQGSTPEQAKASGARVRRVRRSASGDVVMLAPSVLLRELGVDLPSTMGAQQFVACVLGDTL